MSVEEDYMTAEINLHKNAIYIVKDGIMESIESPPNGHGKQTVCWQNHKPTHVDINYTQLLK